MSAFCRTIFRSIFRVKASRKPFRGHTAYDESSASLLRPTSSAGSEPSTHEDFSPKKSQTARPTLPRPTYAEVFTRQSVINLAAYTFLALHSVAFDQLLPILLHHPREKHDSSNTRLPFKFSGGFGLGSSRIGTLFTFYGIIGCFIQFLIFPPVARKFGVLNCFKCCAVAFPVICFVTPYTTLIEVSLHQQIAMCSIMVVKSFAVIFAFPCSVILLTNSAVSLRILGTLNGFAVSISAVGRAAGPALGGAAFTWGLEHGYVITPWWLLGCIAIVGAIPIWYLVEMDGFSKTSSSPSSDDDFGSDEEQLPGIDEDPFGEILEGDEILDYDPDEEALNLVTESSLNRVPSRRKSLDLKESFGEPQGRRRSYSNMERRLSSPIGLRGGSVGPGGDTRLSTGLAASNFGQGTGGTSFS